MLRFIVRRIAMALPTLLLVSIAVFTLIRLIPGDPALLMLGDFADDDSVAALKTQLGLDRSLSVQFVLWLGHVLTGDLGRSISSGQAVLPLILERFRVSAEIVVVAVALAGVVAVPAGMLAAARQRRATDLVLVACATLLLSIPTFWLGLLLLLLFGLKLGWLPIIGYVSIAEGGLAAAAYLAMPVLALFMHEIGVILRMARASALEILGLDYVTHARAKGLSETAVLTRHVFKNAFGPTWTMLGLVLGNLLGGIAVIETVFTIPGLGRLIVDAIFARDYPVIQGALLFTAFVYVLINIVVDLLYPAFDPKVVLK